MASADSIGTTGEHSWQEYLHTLQPVGNTQDRANVSMFVTAVTAVLVTALFYVAIWPLKDTYFGQLFWQSGPVVQSSLAFLSFWAGAILILKRRRLAQQRATMLIDVLPTEIAEKITLDTIPLFIEHLRSLPDRSRESFLITRILRAFDHLRAGKNRGEVASLLTSQSELDAAAIESSYTMVRVVIWAIPILGFIGTVMGISRAVGGFSESLAGVEDIAVLKQSLTTVTTGLAMAFDTTLVALVLSVLIMFPANSVQKADEDLLNWIEEYCNENLLRRLAVGDGERLDGKEIRQAVQTAMTAHHAELAAWTMKLESIGSTLTEQVKEGWESMLERQTEHQRTQADRWKSMFISVTEEHRQATAQLQSGRDQLVAMQSQQAEQLQQVASTMNALTHAVDKMIRGMLQRSAATQTMTTRAMEQSAEAVNKHVRTLRQGIDGLNAALGKLGERQIDVHVHPRNGWFFKRRTVRRQSDA